MNKKAIFLRIFVLALLTITIFSIKDKFVVYGSGDAHTTHTASSTVTGCNSYKCTGCDKYYYNGSWHNSAQQHNSSGRKVVTAATCDDDETYYTYCNRHGNDTSVNKSEVDWEPNTALGHDFSGAWRILDDESHQKKCIRCNEYGWGDVLDDFEDHDLNQGEGISEHKCVCGYTDPQSEHHGFESYGSSCRDYRCSASLGDGAGGSNDPYAAIYALPTEYQYYASDSGVSWLKPKPSGTIKLSFNYEPFWDVVGNDHTRVMVPTATASRPVN